MRTILLTLLFFGSCMLADTVAGWLVPVFGLRAYLYTILITIGFWTWRTKKAHGL